MKSCSRKVWIMNRMLKAFLSSHPLPWFTKKIKTIENLLAHKIPKISSKAACSQKHFLSSIFTEWIIQTRGPLSVYWLTTFILEHENMKPGNYPFLHYRSTKLGVVFAQPGFPRKKLFPLSIISQLGVM